MSRYRIAAIVVFLQAVALPIAMGSRGGLALLIQALLAGLCVGVFLDKRWALWVALVLMWLQVPVIESRQLSLRVGLGAGYSVGVFAGSSFLETRLGANEFAGYVYNFGINRAPARLLTDGKDVTGAYMVNLAVLPAAFLLLGLRRKTLIFANQSPQPTPRTGG